MISRAEVFQVDPYLTNLSIEYANRPDAFIGAKAMPRINTEGKLSGRYRRFKKGSFFRNYNGADMRGSLQKSSRVIVELDTDGTFACVRRALHDGFDEREAREYMSQGMSLDELAVRIVTDAILIAREVRIAALYCSSSILTNYSALTGNDRWDVYTSSSSDPFDDVTTMRNSIHSTTGMPMNTMIIGRQVFNKLQNHPYVIERIKYVMAATVKAITPQLLAAAFGVDQVLIGDVLYVTTKEGQTESLGYVWGKNVIGAYIDPNPTNKTRTLGLRASALDSDDVQFRQWNDETVTGTFVEGQIDEDEVVVDANCGYLLQTVVS
jgi:hypothetical protein